MVLGEGSRERPGAGMQSKRAWSDLVAHVFVAGLIGILFNVIEIWYFLHIVSSLLEPCFGQRVWGRSEQVREQVPEQV